MEDFEFSVEVCDRDWERFFAECEECNLLPPSLAGVDDSGMSDLDDRGSFLAKKPQKVNSAPGNLTSDPPNGGPLFHQGSPVESSLGKHGTGGVESILSDSEEDTHLQSVNMFFERLKGLTEAGPSQARVGNSREATQKEERSDDGQQARRTTLPKNFPELNTLPARGETAAGKETTKPVNTTIKKTEAESDISSEPEACHNLEFKTCKLTKTQLFITEEDCTETKVNEVIHWNQSQVQTETSLFHAVEMDTNVNDATLEGLLMSQVVLRKKCSMRGEQTPSQESSPSASIKRKRRKRRRLSAEAGDGGKMCERQALSDSDGETHATRQETGLCLLGKSCNDPQISPSYTFCPCSEDAFSKDVKTELCHSEPRDGFCQQLTRRQKTCTATGLAENNSTDCQPATFLHQSNGRVISTTSNSPYEDPVSNLQVEESPGLNGHSWLQDIVPGVTDSSQHHKQDLNTDTFQLSDKIKTSRLQNQGNSKCFTAADVQTVGPLSSLKSCVPAVEVCQKDQLSAAKNLLAKENGNIGRDEKMLRQSEAELQLPLENDSQDKHQFNNTTLEITAFSPSAFADVNSASHCEEFSSLESKTCSVKVKTSREVISVNVTPHNPSPHQNCLLFSSSSSDTNQADISLGAKTSNLLPEKNSKSERILSKEPNKSGLRINSLQETNLSLLKDRPINPSDISNVSSCCSLDTKSDSFLKNNLTETSSENQSVDLTEKKLEILSKCKDMNVTSKPENHPDPVCNSMAETEDAVSKPAGETENKEKSVFAMSSFWREMETLTINDILGLRKIGKSAPSTFLPPVQEEEEADSNIFTDMDELKPKKTAENSSSIDSYSPREVTWECEPVLVSQDASIYPKAMLALVADTSEPVFSEMTHKSLKKISKTISVHNLPSLESETCSFSHKGDLLESLEEREIKNIENFPVDSALKKDVDTRPSFSESYSISLPNIFRYVFGEKPSAPIQSAADGGSSFSYDGNSVPETYDHFFSEFDTESFFYPLTTAEEKAKDRPVTIFSYSRSSSRNINFPEAYEYFYASSSSEDSSVGSDDEDFFGPVKVVSRYSQRASLTPVATDPYEDFFTENDLEQDFFSLRSLSFRNANFKASQSQKQESYAMSLVPVQHSETSTLREAPPISEKGYQDLTSSDPRLYELYNRISRQPEQLPLSYEDFQMTVMNPRLDASLLPLKHSDMCLVCIAFASWVLKTANPQVGDAWKAVLLANVSALSAIRYLRKYVKVEAAASEKKLPKLTQS
ncbi:PGC-1 and ERR-induced regulator in muscle protein 1 isoform X1 [Oryzias latipes]|nr:PGC-1 and ERR-induced regulator in muscle protein 1 isoform X1 [Oryzias latipes]